MGYLVATIVALIAIRQIDRLWHSPFRRAGFYFSRPSLFLLTDLKKLQRQRLNNITPVVLAASHWAEILLWCLLASFVPTYFSLLISVTVALKFRHLQEMSHFALHRCLAKSRRIGDLIGEFAFQAPLVKPNIKIRRQDHVIRHHPNATEVGVDPNVSSLYQAGIMPECTFRQFVIGLLKPLTLSGITTAVFSGTVGSSSRWRLVVPLALVLAVFWVAGTRGVVYGLILPRIIFYPVMSWMALLVEHRWFTPYKHKPGDSRAAVEAGRCIRLYGRRPLLEFAARVTWLPYGELFHYAHSVHQSLRWDYLAEVEKILGRPKSCFASAFLGKNSAIRALYKDLTGCPVDKTSGNVHAAGSYRHHVA